MYSTRFISSETFSDEEEKWELEKVMFKVLSDAFGGTR